MFDETTTKRAFLECMQKQDCDSWLRGKRLIDSLLESGPFLSESFKSSIKDNFDRVKNLLMLLYIYSLDVELSSYYSYKDLYEEKFREICADKQAVYAEIFLWIADKKGEEQQVVIQFFIETFPAFIHNKLAYISEIELELMIRVFNQMDVLCNRSTILTADFMTTIQKMTVGELSKQNSKENVIIMAILVVLSGETQGKGTLGLLMDEYLLGQLQQQNIERFCFVHWNFLSELSSHQLLKIFRELFQRGSSAYLLELIIRITNILAEGQDFFKLKEMYANFILPMVAKRFKVCMREGVEKTALALCQLYVVGFSEHCDIGETGVEDLLDNLQAVTSEKYRKKWIQLAFLAAKDEATQGFVQTYLKRIGIGSRLIEQCRHPLFERKPWSITTRSIKQHKAYRKQPSRHKGIYNRQFQCYIISVVQALFMTKKLPALLSKTSKYSKCVHALTEVFKDLEKQVRWRISVNRLQEDGPAEFALSEDQEDAQQYLLALMNKLEECLKQARLEKQFKEIFEVCSQTAITCRHCKHETISKQTEYIHTISHKEKLSPLWEETIFDFVCAFCKKQQSSRRTSLFLSSQILIVHINRFSNVGGKIKKELPSQRVLRRFGNYELVGMLFHIGKFVESGHYVYYSKVGKKRWVEFNDETTSEFDLDQEDEEFEKEFKAEKTPYILFYQKCA